MERDANQLSRLLGEVLLMQKWAAGSSVEAARVFGLLNGFESAVKAERVPFISKETQDRVEDLLEAIGQGRQPCDGTSIKDWLRREKISEPDAQNVMILCGLQGRFGEEIDRVASAVGSTFGALKRPPLSVANWMGSLHYLELVDTTDGASKKLHAVFSPAVPRIGETISPQGGQAMRVVDVEHVIATFDNDGVSRPVLVPHVYLEVIEDDAG